MTAQTSQGGVKSNRVLCSVLSKHLLLLPHTVKTSFHYSVCQVQDKAGCPWRPPFLPGCSSFGQLVFPELELGTLEQLAP
jgi:hypothetical protein